MVKKYFIIAALLALVSFGHGESNKDGSACGLAIAAGLSVIAAAIVESNNLKEKENHKE